jgi:hypothetical protein
MQSYCNVPGLPPFVPVQPIFTLLVFSAPWFFHPRLSLLKCPAPPHCQHTDGLFLWLSVGLGSVNTDAEGASLTGTSSWPVVTHGVPRPLSRGKPEVYPAPEWTLPLYRRRTLKSSGAAVPESALPEPLSRRGLSVPNPLEDALSTRPLLWQSHDDVQPRVSHKCPSVDGHTARLFLHPAVSDQSVLCPGPGTYFQAPLARYTALILLSSLSSTSFLLSDTHIVSTFVEMSDN